MLQAFCSAHGLFQYWVSVFCFWSLQKFQLWTTLRMSLFRRWEFQSPTPVSLKEHRGHLDDFGPVGLAKVLQHRASALIALESRVGDIWTIPTSHWGSKNRFPDGETSDDLESNDTISTAMRAKPRPCTHNHNTEFLLHVVAGRNCLWSPPNPVG